eukprot:4027757-Amphidinium_carterae.1
MRSVLTLPEIMLLPQKTTELLECKLWGKPAVLKQDMLLPRVGGSCRAKIFKGCTTTSDHVVTVVHCPLGLSLWEYSGVVVQAGLVCPKLHIWEGSVNSGSQGPSCFVILHAQQTDPTINRQILCVSNMMTRRSGEGRTREPNSFASHM